jgi:FixJ family two-component response regulator
VIAVVDDEESVRKAIVRVLCAAGLPARGYTSGLEFLETWHFNRPECLVLDLQMAGLSGIEIQRELKIAGAQFPIIIITAHDAPQLREDCLKGGAAAYLCKPLDVDVLVNAIRIAIGASR